MMSKARFTGLGDGVEVPHDDEERWVGRRWSLRLRIGHREMRALRMNIVGLVKGKS